jgi:hypothetical protein
MVRSLSVTVMEAISHPSGRASNEDRSIFSKQGTADFQAAEEALVLVRRMGGASPVLLSVLSSDQKNGSLRAAFACTFTGLQDPGLSLDQLP